MSDVCEEKPLTSLFPVHHDPASHTGLGLQECQEGRKTDPQIRVPASLQPTTGAFQHNPRPPSPKSAALRASGVGPSWRTEAESDQSARSAGPRLSTLAAGPRLRQQHPWASLQTWAHRGPPLGVREAKTPTLKDASGNSSPKVSPGPSGGLEGEGRGGSRASEGFDLKSSRRLNSPSENKTGLPWPSPAFPTPGGTSAWRAQSDTWTP